MKQRDVVFAPEAEADVFALYDWIAGRAGPRAAADYIGRLEAFCSRLDLASERGPLRDDVRPGLRIVGFERRITIAFTVNMDRTIIPRLFYGGRNWEAGL